MNMITTSSVCLFLQQSLKSLRVCCDNKAIFIVLQEVSLELSRDFYVYMHPIQGEK